MNYYDLDEEIATNQGEGHEWHGGTPLDIEGAAQIIAAAPVRPAFVEAAAAPVVVASYEVTRAPVVCADSSDDMDGLSGVEIVPEGAVREPFDLEHTQGYAL